MKDVAGLNLIAGSYEAITSCQAVYVYSFHLGLDKSTEILCSIKALSLRVLKVTGNCVMNRQIFNHGGSLRVFLQLQTRALFCIVCLLVGSSLLKGEDFSTADMFVKPQFMEQVGATVYGGWDSHYFTEGRDALDGGSLIITDVQSGWEFLFGQVWYAVCPDQSYDELQFMAGVTQTIEDFTYYVGHRHIQFPADDLNDDEVAVGVSISNLPAGVQISVDAYYSFEADGYFTEISVNRNFFLTERIIFSSTVVFGINRGYVSDGHNGANHFALTVGLNYPVTDSISIVARLAQSWSIDHDSNLPGDETLVDFLNGGIGMQWSL